MSEDAVEVLSVKRLKNKASRRSVYEALLRARTDELRDTKIDQVERRLFHGTTSKNAAKIFRNGFNRDFNRNQRYGKGTYFSSLAAESARYCKRSASSARNEQSGQFVMLFCRVITGCYCVGNVNYN